MSGRRRFAVVVGTLAILVSFAVSVTTSASEPSSALTAVVWLVALAGVVGALWKVAASVDDPDVASPPWTESGALFERLPERSRTDQALSGVGLVEVVDAAGETARAEGSIESGLALVRPELRAALVEVLVQGGSDREAVETALAEGSWTDDRMAAAVLDAGVEPPDGSIRRRVRAWLFPERAVVRRTGRAVQAMAEAADDALPTVVGQRAPRNVTVLPPTLEELQRAVDGTLRPAVDARATAREAEPISTPQRGADSGETAADERRTDPQPNAQRNAGGQRNAGVESPEAGDDIGGGTAVSDR